MRGINSETVDLIYLDPPFKKQKPFKAKMTVKTEQRLMDYLAMCEDGRDPEFAKQALEYIATLRNDKQEIIMQFNDAWYLSDVKRELLEKLKADHVDIHKFINSVPEDDMKAFLIFMAVRIIEMHRILKPTGSIYFHSDQEANSYIRVVMDLVFGKDKQRGEIVWCYTNPSKVRTYFPRKHDTLYFYTKSDVWTFNDMDIRVPYKSNLILATRMGGKNSAENYDEYKSRGKIPESWWVQEKGNGLCIAAKDPKQYIGYPTQKPVALLERIIKASSNEGDIVFDPFAGCATAIDAAYNLNRQWIACDISYISVILLRLRLEGPGTLLNKYPYKRTATKSSIRSDVKVQIDYSYEGIAKRVNVRKLFGPEIYTRQDGKCAMSGERVDYLSGDIVHIKPPSDGGSNDIDNLQFVSTKEHRKKTERENSKC